VGQPRARAAAKEAGGLGEQAAAPQRSLGLGAVQLEGPFDGLGGGHFGGCLLGFGLGL
jgi:hypothetical protein